MKLYFARHGRTNYNDLHLCNADPAVDVYLTSAGVEQAKALADKLKSTPIGHIYVSRLKRTQQTADIVNAFHEAPVEVDARLDDHRSGFEGKPFALLKDALDAADNQWTARFNDGESIEDIKKRVAAFLDDLRTKPYDSVLIVTSQWIIRAAMAINQHLSNEEAWELVVVQGSCLELEI
jgi:broad specificity phosphatase PhoE